MDKEKRTYRSREGKKAVTVYLDHDHYRALRIKGAIEDKTLQDVIREVIAKFVSNQKS